MKKQILEDPFALDYDACVIALDQKIGTREFLRQMAASGLDSRSDLAPDEMRTRALVLPVEILFGERPIACNCSRVDLLRGITLARMNLLAVTCLDHEHSLEIEEPRCDHCGSAESDAVVIAVYDVSVEGHYCSDCLGAKL